MNFDRDTAQAALSEWFAPWVQDLGLIVEEAHPGHVRVRQPHDPRFSRGVGGMSGQAIMAAIDTAMVLAVQTTLTERRLVTTVSQTTNFLRPIVDSDVIYEIDITKSGRTLAFGSARGHAAGAPDRICFTATMTYAILDQAV